MLTDEFPWQVSLQWRFSWYTYHICGATVLSDSWVVTAAHCTHAYQTADLVVVGGTNDVQNKDGGWTFCSYRFYAHSMVTIL